MKKTYKYIAISVVVVLFITWYITQMRLEVVKEKALLLDPYIRYLNYYYDEDEEVQFESEEEKDEFLTSIFNLDWERKLLLDPLYYLNQYNGESLPTLKFYSQVKYDSFFRDEYFFIEGIIYGDNTKTNQICYKYKGVEYVYITKNSFDVSKLKP